MKAKDETVQPARTCTAAHTVCLCGHQLSNTPIPEYFSSFIEHKTTSNQDEKRASALRMPQRRVSERFATMRSCGSGTERQMVRDSASGRLHGSESETSLAKRPDRTRRGEASDVKRPRLCAFDGRRGCNLAAH
eukprot:656340-Pleurochrysis_carterae.AAC.3